MSEKFSTDVIRQAREELKEEQFREQVEACKTDLRERQASLYRLRQFLSIQALAWATLFKPKRI